VVQACLETGVRRLVYTSSIHAIIEPPPGTIIDESLPFEMFLIVCYSCVPVHVRTQQFICSAFTIFRKPEYLLAV